MNQSQIVASRRARAHLVKIGANVNHFAWKVAHGPQEDFERAVGRKTGTERALDEQRSRIEAKQARRARATNRELQGR